MLSMTNQTSDVVYVPNNAVLTNAPAKTIRDLATEIRREHVEIADILASVLVTLCAESPDVPGYKEPESLLMDLGCEAERAEYIRKMAVRIRDLI